MQLVINRNHGEELIAEVNHVNNGPIWLKVEVDRLTRRFYTAATEKIGARQVY